MTKRKFTTAIALGVVAAAASLGAPPSLAHDAAASQITVKTHTGVTNTTTVRFFVQDAEMKAIKLNWCPAKDDYPSSALDPQMLTVDIMCATRAAHTGYGKIVESAPANGYISTGWKEEEIPQSLIEGNYFISITLDNGEKNHDLIGNHPKLKVAQVYY